MSLTVTSPSPDRFNRIMEITPAQAATWLENNEGNRPINWNYVMQMVRDIKTGQFACTHQGIAFDTSGKLIDGQHRLWAIFEADIPVTMHVFFNEPPESIIQIDGNHPRRAADRITLGRTLGTVRAEELAALRAMLGGLAMAEKRRTVHEEMTLLEKHRSAVLFALENLSWKRPAGLANSMTRAVVARAWYCAPDLWQVKRFCEVLKTGIAGGEQEHLIVNLRDQLLELRQKLTTRTVRQRQYGLTSRALSAYLNHEALTIIRVPISELFILPDEMKEEAA